MKLSQILEQELENKELMQYNEDAIKDAIMSDDPYNELKKVFPRDFLPKVYRWLEDKLEKVKVSEDAKKLEGGEFGAKLDKYLLKDKGEQTYENSVEALLRDLMNSIEKWQDYETKPRDLPKTGIK